MRTLKTLIQAGPILFIIFVIYVVIYLNWGIGNLPGLRAGLTELFDKSGARVSSFKVYTVGGTRKAYCTFHASNAQVQKLIQYLELRKPTSDSNECDCSSPDNKLLRIYVVYGRPKKLHFQNEGGFEYLKLYQHTDSDEVCLAFCTIWS